MNKDNLTEQLKEVLIQKIKEEQDKQKLEKLSEIINRYNTLNDKLDCILNRIKQRKNNAKGDI